MKRILALLICVCMLTNPFLAAFADENVNAQEPAFSNEESMEPEAAFDEEAFELLEEDFAELIGEEEEYSTEDGSAEEAVPEEEDSAEDPLPEEELSADETPEEETELPAEEEIIPEPDEDFDGEIVLDLTEETVDSFDLDNIANREIAEEFLNEEASGTFNGRYGNELSGRAHELYAQYEKRYHTNRGNANFTYTFDTPYTFRITVSGSSIVNDSYLETARNTVYRYLQMAQDAFLYDYPDVFWVGTISGSYSIQGYKSGGTWYGKIEKISITPNEIYSGAKNAISSFDKSVENTFTAIRKKFGANKDRYTVVKTIHDHICEALYYNNDSSRIVHSAICMYKNDKRAVCEGYAKIFKVLCNKFGIPCVLVVGSTYNDTTGQGHMWNYVKMDDDCWYLVDATWDDSSSGYGKSYLLIGRYSTGASGRTVYNERTESRDFSGTGVFYFTYPTLSSYAYSKPSSPVHRDITNLVLDRSAMKMKVGEKKQLYATLIPVDATNQKITWKTSNSKVATVSSSGKVTGKGVGTCKITAVSANTSIKKTCTVTVLFKDVSSDHTYANAIYWGVEKGIVAGFSDGTFRPGASCTRGQAVMFLWRAAGKPNPKTTGKPFKDVPTTHAYYKAILWASEKGIVTGYKDKTFRPDKACTRGQIVTFLWRYKGKKAAKSGAKKFPDVPSSHTYYKAIMWASSYGIALGFSDGKFKPGQNCTRGQIVTFIYRMMT